MGGQRQLGNSKKSYGRPKISVHSYVFNLSAADFFIKLSQRPRSLQRITWNLDHNHQLDMWNNPRFIGKRLSRRASTLGVSTDGAA
jgi:hypothetical protein